jgi:hypothetical protein
MGGKFWTFHNWRFLALGFPKMWHINDRDSCFPRAERPEHIGVGVAQGCPGFPGLYPRFAPPVTGDPPFWETPRFVMFVYVCHVISAYFFEVVHVILWLCKKCADTWILPNGIKIHNMTHGPTGRHRSIDDKQFKATFARYLQGSYPHPKREIVSMLL